ncbi:TonB-dependent receptor plug domain-containing protein [Pseudoxanthomonas mexicana]
MKRNALATSLAQALFCAALLPASLAASAQNQAPDAGTAGDPKQLDTVVVQAEIAYRDRTDDIAPTLVYDLEYFQRFEPNTVGDMLKRVPGVGFVGSDIMEYDGVQLRGLGGGYTQVLINGKKVPGAGDDRSMSTASPRRWWTTSRSSAAPAPTAAAMRWPARSTSCCATPTSSPAATSASA